MKKRGKIKSVIYFVAIIFISVSCSKDKNPVPPKIDILDEIVFQINNQRYGEVHSLLIAKDDSLKEKITIRNLLTMTSGFTWDEWTTLYNDPNNDVVRLIQSNDWIKYVLDRPMSHSPVTYLTYN